MIIVYVESFQLKSDVLEWTLNLNQNILDQRVYATEVQSDTKVDSLKIFL